MTLNYENKYEIKLKDINREQPSKPGHYLCFLDNKA